MTKHANTCSCSECHGTGFSTEKKLAEMSPEELRRLWMKADVNILFQDFLHALIQRATREADSVWRQRWSDEARIVNDLHKGLSEAESERDSAVESATNAELEMAGLRAQLAEAERTIGSLKSLREMDAGRITAFERDLNDALEAKDVAERKLAVAQRVEDGRARYTEGLQNLIVDLAAGRALRTKGVEQTHLLNKAQAIESTIAALREQVARAKTMGAFTMVDSLLRHESHTWDITESAAQKVRAELARIRERLAPAPHAAAPSGMGYALSVDPAHPEGTVTVSHNGKPVFTVALAQEGGR